MQTTRRDFLKVVGLGAVALTTLGRMDLRAQSSGTRPNIVLIMVDDMGYSDLGCYGGEIETPNLDNLAKNGLRFRQFYNTSKCFPTRACLMTGLYAQQVGMGQTNGTLANCATLGETLRTVGYRTLMSGKWHGLDNPYDRGFDRYYGLRDGAMNHFNPGDQRPGEPDPAQKDNRVWAIDETVYAAGTYTPPAGFYSTDAFSDQAIEYLENYGNEEKPFFLHITYTAPHWPLHAWPNDIAKYQGTYDAAGGWDAIRQSRYDKQKTNGIVENETNMVLSPADRSQGSWSSLTQADKDEWDLRMAIHAAMVDRIDQKIGDVLAKIEELGQTNNTLVLFCSDNGAAATAPNHSNSGSTLGTIDSYEAYKQAWANVSETPFRKFKNSSLEGGICTPLIAYWPDVIQGVPTANGGTGETTQEVGHMIDFMATFIDVAGAIYPTTMNGETVYPLEGKSLLPIFETGTRTGHDVLYWQWLNGKAVRQGDWKLVIDNNGSWKLYDLSVDRTELNDLSASNPTKYNELVALYDAWEARPDITV